MSFLVHEKIDNKLIFSCLTVFSVSLSYNWEAYVFLIYYRMSINKTCGCEETELIIKTGQKVQ